MELLYILQSILVVNFNCIDFRSLEDKGGKSREQYRGTIELMYTEGSYWVNSLSSR